MNVLLLRPPELYQHINFQDLLRICRTNVPLGLMHISSVCDSIGGVNSQIIDPLANAEMPNFSRQKFPLKEFQWGEDLEYVLGRDLQPDFKPDIVGISVMYFHLFESCKQAVQIVRKNFPESIIVIGGADPTAKFEKYLQTMPEIDLVVLGEGELIFEDFLKKIQNKEDWRKSIGIAYRKDDAVVTNERPSYIKNLEIYPPNYSAIDMEKYFRANKKNFPARVTYQYENSHRAISFITSRGCPFKCTFCSISLHMGKAFRPTSPADVVKEMAFLVEKYQVRHFHFDDDNLTLNLNRFKEICRGIIELNLKITWDTPNGIRGDIMDDEAVKLMKDSGCTYLIFGLESLSQETIDKEVKKRMNLKKALNNLKRCYDQGIDTGAFYIIGFPDESRASIWKTILLSCWLFLRYKTRPHLNIAKPYQGTELYKNWIQKKDKFEGEHRFKESPSLTTMNGVSVSNVVSMKYLNRCYRIFQRMFVLISVLNWIQMVLCSPLKGLKLTTKLSKNFTLNVKTVRGINLVKSYLGVFLFPLAIIRKDLPD